MNESTVKRLMDFIGEEYEIDSPNYNRYFDSGDDWQLIADEIAKRGEWEKVYNWYWGKVIKDKYCTRSMATLRYFHEKQPTEKSAIVAEWLESVADS